MLRRNQPRTYVDPLAPPEIAPVRYRPPSTLVQETEPQDLQFNPHVAERPFRPHDAVTFRGTPVGAAGVRAPHKFNPSMIFVVDDVIKPVPPPNVTQAVRESVFMPWQRWHYQFHINPAWGRFNGRYPRFSFINLIAKTGNSEAQLNRQQSGKGALFGVRGMRPGPRFTRVLRYPRVDATPQTYGPGGYST